VTAPAILPANLAPELCGPRSRENFASYRVVFLGECVALEKPMERSSTVSFRPVRLDPGHPIYLTPSGQPGEKELASAFRSAWRLVPPAARRTILGYWCDLAARPAAAGQRAFARRSRFG
jgi:hypothetical protein